MLKSTSSRAASLDDLLEATKKVSKSTVLRRWIVRNPAYAALGTFGTALVLFAAGLPLALSFGAPIVGVILFFIWPAISLCWRLRTELVFGAVFIGSSVWLSIEAAIFCYVAFAAIVAAVPATRKYATKYIWMVMTRHRLRGVLSRALGRKCSRVPSGIWAKCTPVGERIFLWLPSGLSLSNVQSLLPEIAAACWARSATVTKSGRFSHVITIDVIRHDQLAADTQLETQYAQGQTTAWTPEIAQSADSFVTDFLAKPRRRTPKTTHAVAAVPRQTSNGKVATSTVDAVELDDPF